MVLASKGTLGVVIAQLRGFQVRGKCRGHDGGSLLKLVSLDNDTALDMRTQDELDI